jgi:purine-binding chemotaxis protein CheW
MWQRSSLVCNGRQRNNMLQAVAPHKPEAPVAYALARIGNLQVAVAAESVLQANAIPAEVTYLQSKDGIVTRVFTHHNAIVPLVDLRQWFKWTTPDTRPLTQALILKSAGRQVAIAIDGVDSIEKVSKTQISAVHQNPDVCDFFHSVIRLDEQKAPVGILDADALMVQTQVWIAAQDETTHLATVCAPTATSAMGSAAGSRNYCVVQLGETILAVPADQVGEIQHMPQLQRINIPDVHLFGFLVWKGRTVPVVNLLGQHSTSIQSPLLLVIHTLDRCIAFPVSALQAVVRIPSKDIQPSDLSHADFGQGSVILGNGTRALVVDGAKVIEHWAITSLSTMAGVPNEIQALPRSTLPNALAYIVYRAGEQFATPINTIEHVTDFPTHYTPAHGSLQGELGTFEWRGSPVLLIDAKDGTAQTSGATHGNSRVLIIRHGEGYLGMVVDSVDALIPPHLGLISKLSIGGGKPLTVITTGSGVAQMSYQITDAIGHKTPRAH